MQEQNSEGDGRDRTESLASAIITEIAEQEGTDPTKIDPPLYDVLDPDALDSLFVPTKAGRARSGGHVAFIYCGYEVTAFSDGDVRARELTDSVDSDSPMKNSTAGD